ACRYSCGTRVTYPIFCALLRRPDFNGPSAIRNRINAQRSLSTLRFDGAGYCPLERCLGAPAVEDWSAARRNAFSGGKNAAGPSFVFGVSLISWYFVHSCCVELRILYVMHMRRSDFSYGRREPRWLVWRAVRSEYRNVHSCRLHAA